MSSFEGLEKAIGRKFTASELLSVKVISLPEAGVIRTVYGPLAGALQIDYADGSLHQIKELVEAALQVLEQLAPQAFDGRDIQVFQGSNHLDVIDNGVGSAGWLVIADNLK